MFGLFTKKKPKSAGSAARDKSGAAPSREQIMKQAMSNVRAARENIGEEALDEIAKALQKRENSAMEQARKKIRSLDQERVADNIRAMLYDEDK